MKKPFRRPPIYTAAKPLNGYPKPCLMAGDVIDGKIYSSWGTIYPNTFWGTFRYGYRRFYKETAWGRTIKKILIIELIIFAVLVISNKLFRESYHAKYIKRNLG